MTLQWETIVEEVSERTYGNSNFTQYINYNIYTETNTFSSKASRRLMLASWALIVWEKKAYVLSGISRSIGTCLTPSIRDAGDMSKWDQSHTHSGASSTSGMGGGGAHLMSASWPHRCHTPAPWWRAQWACHRESPLVLHASPYQEALC